VCYFDALFTNTFIRIKQKNTRKMIQKMTKFDLCCILHLVKRAAFILRVVKCIIAMESLALKITIVAMNCRLSAIFILFMHSGQYRQSRYVFRLSVHCICLFVHLDRSCYCCISWTPWTVLIKIDREYSLAPNDVLIWLLRSGSQQAVKVVRPSMSTLTCWSPPSS